MDAHDIFKNLTCGVKFTRKVKLNQVTGCIKPEIESLKIKLETQDVSSEVAAEHKNVCSKKSLKRKAKDVEEDRISALKKSEKIVTIGKEVPPPITSFEELKIYGVSTRLIKNLITSGYSIPTPIQMQAIPIMLKGRSLMACAPTGSGKTVAFLAPVFHDLKGPEKHGFRCIILCPSRELTKQTYRECLRLTEHTGLKIHMINKIKEGETKYAAGGSKKCDILVSTPNRICYMLLQNPPMLDLTHIEWFIADEADKLIEDEGENSFKEQFDQILSACTNTKKKIALFSATYTVPVAKWAHRNLKRLIKLTIGERNSAAELVQQELLFVGSEPGKLLAFRDLVKGGLHPPVLIFVQSRDRAKQLFDELIYDGINVDVIHADRPQQQRDNVVKAFREGKIWILICTELMGRGIDFKGVNLVINYDFPPSTIAYIHRIGRTGRAGRPGRAITFFTQDDAPQIRSVAQIIKNSGGTVPEFMLKMKKVKKSDRKKFLKRAPERENISSNPKYLKKRKRNTEIEDGSNFSMRNFKKFKNNNVDGSFV